MKPEPPVTRKRDPASSTRAIVARASLQSLPMCGLCGIVALGRPPETATVATMAASLDHRGPDGDGAFDDEGVAFGFRRLAIIDLSEAGMQPFASDDGALRLMHNGEVYNYRELRRELEGRGHRFRSASDTEVILRAYEQWGDRCVERFNGMWAFALWDGRKRRLFASRDRFGVKPFYYRWDGGRFAFASELKAFRAAGPLEPHLPAVRDYLEQGYVDHTDETFFAGIRKLPPAHSLVVDEHGLRLQRYWALEPRAEPDGDATEEVRELFLDAVRLRLRSDVPVGTCLSGGIDSSAIVCVGRPPPAHRGRERAAGRRAPADVHRVLRGARASTSVRTRRRSSSERARSRTGSRSARASSSTRCRRSSARRTSRSARRRSSRSGS